MEGGFKANMVWEGVERDKGGKREERGKQTIHHKR